MGSPDFRVKHSKSGSERDVTVIHVHTERPIPPAKDTDKIVTVHVKPVPVNQALAEVATTREE